MQQIPFRNPPDAEKGESVGSYQYVPYKTAKEKTPCICSVQMVENLCLRRSCYAAALTLPPPRRLGLL